MEQLAKGNEKMSLEDILKQKQEIMDMIYNVGFIFFFMPILFPFIIGMLMMVSGFDPEESLNVGGAVAQGSVMWSGFVTMMYMAYKMMNIKGMSFVSFLRILAKVIFRRFS